MAKYLSYNFIYALKVYNVVFTVFFLLCCIVAVIVYSLTYTHGTAGVMPRILIKQ
jgi:hypothetical protein